MCFHSKEGGLQLNVPVRELLTWSVFSACWSSEQAAREYPLALAAAMENDYRELD